MASVSGDVEVQGPPGLDCWDYFHGPPRTNAACPLSTAARGRCNPSCPKSQDEIVEELAEVVRDHVEQRTNAVMHKLWERGEKEMVKLQLSHVQQIADLQAQLKTITEAHQNLLRENILLHRGIEELSKHITIFSPHDLAMSNVPRPGFEEQMPSKVLHPSQLQFSSPHMEPMQVVPQGGLTPIPDENYSSSTYESVEPQRVALPASRGYPSPFASRADEARFLSNPPQAHAPNFDATICSPPMCSPTITSPSDHGMTPFESSGSPVEKLLDAPGSDFTITLRRADSVGLGLTWHHSPDGKSLVVEEIVPGGAVEAWNRQCADDSRDIRPGDSITTINTKKDGVSMQAESNEKHLLTLSMVRGPVDLPDPLFELPPGLRHLRGDGAFL